MSSTYTPNKGIEEPAYNDYAANPTGWTSPINNNWTYLDTALGGSTSLNQTGLSGTQVLSTAQYRPLSLIVSGTPTSLVTYQVPSGVGGQWIIRNTSSSTVAFNSGAGGGTVAVGANSNVSISCDGTSTGIVLTNYTAPSAAGSNTQVQYNSGGILAGSAGLTFDGTTLTATGLNANGNVTLGASAGSTFTWNPNTVTLGAGAINIGSSTLYLNSGTQQVGIGTTTVGSNKLTVAGTVASTAGGFVFPDSTVQTTAGLSIPSGTLVAFAGSSAPSSWLLCYGQAISRTTYSDLFSAIGTIWGNGDGSTTFNVPDLRGRLVAGADNMGGSPAGRLGGGASGGITGSATVGATGGEQNHQLTVSELAAHTHAGSNTTVSFGTGGGSSVTTAYIPTTTGSTGGDAAHNNVQPTAVANWIIKT